MKIATAMIIERSAVKNEWESSRKRGGNRALCAHFRIFEKHMHTQKRQNTWRVEKKKMLF